MTKLGLLALVAVSFAFPACAQDNRSSQAVEFTNQSFLKTDEGKAISIRRFNPKQFDKVRRMLARAKDGTKVTCTYSCGPEYCIPGCDPPDENHTITGCSSCYSTGQNCTLVGCR
ncbi:hypothetical protein ACRAVF_06605 [Bradyrhizobium oligotrophicum S58]